MLLRLCYLLFVSHCQCRSAADEDVDYDVYKVKMAVEFVTTPATVAASVVVVLQKDMNMILLDAATKTVTATAVLLIVSTTQYALFYIVTQLAAMHI